MIEKIISYLKYGSNYCSIEITTIQSRETYYITQATKKNGEFVDLRFDEVDSLSDLVNILPKNQSCQLIINSDDVLIKEVSFSDNPAAMVSEAFPSLNTSNFYYEILVQNSKGFVSVCKKSEVEKIVKSFLKSKIHVIRVQLGFSSIHPIVPLISADEIQCSNLILEVGNINIETFRKQSEQRVSYSVDDIFVESDYLLSLGGLFNYLDETTFTASNLSPFVKDITVRFNETVFFKKGTVIALAILMVVVFTNLFYFNSYRKEFNELQNELQLSTSQRELYAKSMTNLEKKQLLVDNLLGSGNSKTSYYINRIVNNKPESVGFDTMTFQPLEKGIRPNKEIEYSERTMLIKGKSKDKTEFSNWIEQLEGVLWVEKVTIINYANENSGTDLFEIDITVLNES